MQQRGRNKRERERTSYSICLSSSFFLSFSLLLCWLCARPLTLDDRRHSQQGWCRRLLRISRQSAVLFSFTALLLLLSSLSNVDYKQMKLRALSSRWPWPWPSRLLNSTECCTAAERTYLAALYYMRASPTVRGTLLAAAAMPQLVVSIFFLWLRAPFAVPFSTSLRGTAGASFMSTVWDIVKEERLGRG